MKRTVVSLLLALVVAGCASTGKEMLSSWAARRTLIGLPVPAYFSAQAYDVPRTHDPQGIIGHSLIMCEPAGPSFWRFPVINDPMYGSCPPARVRITNDPNDEEAWATETRRGHSVATDPRVLNSPFGIAFLSRERCEAFRAEHPTYTKPHEVCEVIHFKRLSVPEPPPEWARRRPEVTPPVTVAPTPPRSSHTMVVGTWSGMLHGQQRSYPLTITFRNDGTYQATSATLNAGSFDGTWQLSGGNVVWEAVTTGRTGTATVQEAEGKPTLRMVPDDRTYTAELTPFDLRTWLAGKWDGSGGGYALTISSNLTWEYTSTVGGRWFAYGTAQIKEPGTVVLAGWFRGGHRSGPDERLTMILHRYDESLTGEFRLSQTWRVSFSRAGRPATK